MREWIEAELHDVDPFEEDEEALQVGAALREIDLWRRTHAYPLALVTPGVRNWVSQETAGPLIVGQRLKRMERIIEKLVRMPTMRLAQMEDIAGCRAVLHSPAEVDAVAYRIRRKWDVRAESDYRSEGKPLTGYRSLHIVVLRRERLVEIQLRTAQQHNWAEIVESTSSRLGFALKDGFGPPELVEYFAVASHIIGRQDNQVAVEDELVDRLTELRRQVAHYFVPDRRPTRGRRRSKDR